MVGCVACGHECHGGTGKQERPGSSDEQVAGVARAEQGCGRERDADRDERETGDAGPKQQQQRGDDDGQPRERPWERLPQTRFLLAAELPSVTPASRTSSSQPPGAVELWSSRMASPGRIPSRQAGDPGSTSVTIVPMSLKPTPPSGVAARLVSSPKTARASAAIATRYSIGLCTMPPSVAGGQ